VDQPQPPALAIAIATTPEEQERCFSIRVAVFVDEQNVPPELELDEHDFTATHFLATVAGDPAGTARLLEYNDHATRVAKIGRVAVVPAHRRQGVGAAIMHAVLQTARERGYKEALLDSQTYILAFYRQLGFVAEGEEFLDAGIPHFRMRRRL
jgi:predicted GNAT family N-acyltransferase